MVFYLNQIPLGRSTATQQVTLSEEQIREAGFRGDIDCRAEIDRLSIQVVITIQYESVVGLECARCTDPISLPIKGSCTIVLKHISERQEDDEEYGVDRYYADEDEGIDLRDIVYEEIVTNIPMMPLCSSECKGVIIQNESIQHDDRPQKHPTVDPRWEALRKMSS